MSKGRPTHDVAGEKGITSFEVAVPSSSLYYFNFWLLPPMLPDKTLATYDVAVDGKTVGRIIPEKGDWHAVGLEGNHHVLLQEGEKQAKRKNRHGHNNCSDDTF